jgi:hypothetical protein
LNGDILFGSPASQAFFADNYSSNFNSNFADPFIRIVFINTNIQNQPETANPPPKRVIDKLKHFKMNEKYCKKDGDKLEYPSCSVCLTEIEKGQDTILVTCGHMFHNTCIMKWFEGKNTCPVCRFVVNEENVKGGNEFSRNNSNIQENSNQQTAV